jgi:hypothetical protein
VADELKIPAPEDEARLWSLIEAGWAPLGAELCQARQELVTRRAGSQAGTSALAGALARFLDALAGRCRTLAGAELTCLDRVVERKLWEICTRNGSVISRRLARGFPANRART